MLFHDKQASTRMMFLLFSANLICSLNLLYANGDTLGVLVFPSRMQPFEKSVFDKPFHECQTFRKETSSFSFESYPPRRKTFLNAPYAKFIIPTLCVAYGTAARFNDFPIRRFDKHIAEQVDKHINKHYGIDNYFQVTPAVFAWGLDFVPGIKAQHNFRDRTLILATSYAFMVGSVHTIKNVTSIERPRKWGEFNSFPSGHTAVAFTGAHILYKEYKDCSPWIGIGGYLIASTTGTLRVINRAHWVSDIVTGAGIGILSAEVGYMMLPVWHRLFGIREKNKQIAFMPHLGFQSAGVNLIYIF